MVVKDFWEQGVARRLLEIIEDHVLKNGISRIQAMVRVNNERGFRFYTRVEYEIEGTHEHVAIIDGEPYDEYHIANSCSQERYLVTLNPSPQLQGESEVVSHKHRDLAPQKKG